MRGGGQFLDFVGGTTVVRAGHIAHGGPPSPPLGKTLAVSSALRTIKELLFSFIFSQRPFRGHRNTVLRFSELDVS